MKKLKTFNFAERAPRRGKATLGVNLRTGTFRLSGFACEELGIKPGDRVDFHQSAEDDRDWYLSKAANGGVTVRKQTTGAGLVFNSSALAQDLRKSLEYKPENGSMIVATTPEELDGLKVYALITATLKPQKVTF